jgi:hypothetical protein
MLRLYLNGACSAHGLRVHLGSAQATGVTTYVSQASVRRKLSPSHSTYKSQILIVQSWVIKRFIGLRSLHVSKQASGEYACWWWGCGK